MNLSHTYMWHICIFASLSCCIVGDPETMPLHTTSWPLPLLIATRFPSSHHDIHRDHHSHHPSTKATNDGTFIHNRERWKNRLTGNRAENSWHILGLHPANRDRVCVPQTIWFVPWHSALLALVRERYIGLGLLKGVQHYVFYVAFFSSTSVAVGE